MVMKKGTLIFLLALLAATPVFPRMSGAEDSTSHRLFHIERKMAYGFKVRDQQSEQLTLDMKADIDRQIQVVAVEDTFRALIKIDGHRAILTRIYIFAEEGGILPKVKYLEMFGLDLETREQRYEKYLP
jgi:hypothetical protein